jgi:hypothetical protein
VKKRIVAVLMVATAPVIAQSTYAMEAQQERQDWAVEQGRYWAAQDDKPEDNWLFFVKRRDLTIYCHKPWDKPTVDRLMAMYSMKLVALDFKSITFCYLDDAKKEATNFASFTFTHRR